MKQKVYDYIVVGAGSAGCAAAYRIALNSDAQVLLIEAGGSDCAVPIKVPAGVVAVMGEGKYNWNYASQPEPGLNDRSILLPRGKVMGGTSSINGMVYVRGQRRDYDEWASAGNSGWAYEELLPLFKRSENHWRGADDYHADQGPLHVRPPAKSFDIGEAFIEAVASSGIDRNADFNGAQQTGVGYFDVNISSGLRHSSAKAFLKRQIKPNNLTILKRFSVHRILFDGTRSRGVEGFRHDKPGEPIKLSADAEVIVSAGAFNSPKLLELSGIGDGERLVSLGIDVIADLPGVGENLQDHCNTHMYFTSLGCETYYQHLRGWRAPLTALNYALRRKGIIANPAALIGVFYALDGSSDRPDTQIHFLPGAALLGDDGKLAPVAGICASTCRLRPRSVGSVHITSTSPETSPAIQLNLLDHPDDQQHQLQAVRKLREFLNRAPIAEFVGEELQPLNGRLSDQDLLEGIRQHSESGHHAAGSCRMGIDEQAVVTPELKVRGVDGLRVADASIMPRIVSGNTHAPSVMIGEKLADLVL